MFLSLCLSECCRGWGNCGINARKKSGSGNLSLRVLSGSYRSFIVVQPRLPRDFKELVAVSVLHRHGRRVCFPADFDHHEGRSRPRQSRKMLQRHMKAVRYSKAK